MTDLYLIAHKVRGEAAFDVATRMDCPMCIGSGIEAQGYRECVECDGLGYWWIIPTSGHRAYPYAHSGFSWKDVGPMPDGTPDHYPTKAEPNAPTLAERLGLTKAKATLGKITRRI